MHNCQVHSEALTFVRASSFDRGHGEGGLPATRFAILTEGEDVVIIRSAWLVRLLHAVFSFKLKIIPVKF